MPIIGLSFNKILVEKKAQATGKMSINNNVSLKDVTETELNLGKQKQKAAVFHFEFTSDYEPEIAKILLEGEVIFMEEDKKIKQITSEWKKDKKVEKDVMTLIMNNVLQKCNIEALILSKDMNLPSPVPLPRVGVNPGEGENK